MDRHWPVENINYLIYNFWCKVREIQPFEISRAELRRQLYTFDMCDLWSNINPGVMLSLFLKYLQVLFGTFFLWCSLRTIFGWDCMFWLPGTGQGLYIACILPAKKGPYCTSKNCVYPKDHACLQEAKQVIYMNCIQQVGTACNQCDKHACMMICNHLIETA